MRTLVFEHFRRSAYRGQGQIVEGLFEIGEWRPRNCSAQGSAPCLELNPAHATGTRVPRPGAIDGAWSGGTGRGCQRSWAVESRASTFQDHASRASKDSCS